MYKNLKDFKKNIFWESFIGTLAYAIEENLYNYKGYLVENNK